MILGNSQDPATGTVRPSATGTGQPLDVSDDDEGAGPLSGNLPNPDTQADSSAAQSKDLQEISVQ